MKTFDHLINEIQASGRCHHCGGCVTFCTAINYGALKLDEDGKPVFKDSDKCIECGICYMVCPEIDELEEEIKKQVQWSPPNGRIIGFDVSRAKDPFVLEKGTDGGVVTSLLLHLFDIGFIDGAIVTKQIGMHRQPWLAASREDIIEAAGSHFDTMHGLASLGDHYSTYSPSILGLDSALRGSLNRIAMVGTPCQIKSARKMQAYGIVPSDSIKYYLGLFCTSSFRFDEEKWKRVEDLGDFKTDAVKKVNIKDEFLIHLKNGEVKRISLDELSFAKREACNYCDDFSAEFADISFGGIGAEMGWTTVVIRTPLGKAIFEGASNSVLERYKSVDNPKFATHAMEKVMSSSDRKRVMAEIKLQKLKMNL